MSSGAVNNRQVLTVTLNPAIDTTLFLQTLEDDANRVTEELRQAGGKGVNVGAALRTLGIDCRNLILAGEENLAEYRRLLGDIPCRIFPIPGPIRENLTLCLPGRTVKINRKGGKWEASALEELARAAEGCSSGRIAVSGSLPEGMDEKAFAGFLERLQKGGAELFLDSSGLTPALLRRVRPCCIKPNLAELAALLGKKISEDTLPDDLRELRRMGAAIILLSMGERGMLLACGEGIYRVSVPPVEVKSAVGAGDSSLAGFVAASVRGKSSVEAAVFAAACGTASVTEPGTGGLNPETVRSLLPRIRVEKMSES